MNGAPARWQDAQELCVDVVVDGRYNLDRQFPDCVDDALHALLLAREPNRAEADQRAPAIPWTGRLRGRLRDADPKHISWHRLRHWVQRAVRRHPDFIALAQQPGRLPFVRRSHRQRALRKQLAEKRPKTVYEGSLCECPSPARPGAGRASSSRSPPGPQGHSPSSFVEILARASVDNGAEDRCIVERLHALPGQRALIGNELEPCRNEAFSLLGVPKDLHVRVLCPSAQRQYAASAAHFVSPVG
jgi:hypothetical protein